MARISWRRSEIEFLIKNYDSMTTEELCRELGGRSKKAINRKLEKLRDEGKIGHRTRETVKRAYYQRSRQATNESTLRTTRRRRGRLPVEDYRYEDV